VIPTPADGTIPTDETGRGKSQITNLLQQRLNGSKARVAAPERRGKQLESAENKKAEVQRQSSVRVIFHAYNPITAHLEGTVRAIAPDAITPAWCSYLLSGEASDYPARKTFISVEMIARILPNQGHAVTADIIREETGTRFLSEKASYQ